VSNDIYCYGAEGYVLYYPRFCCRYDVQTYTVAIVSRDIFCYGVQGFTLTKYMCVGGGICRLGYNEELIK
jgi:hypothetical protein